MTPLLLNQRFAFTWLLNKLDLSTFAGSLYALGTVSYTHLDVYKRQELRKATSFDRADVSCVNEHNA